jgi:hypothetical protein
MSLNSSAVSWTASATRSSSLMSTIRGSAPAADLVDLLGRSTYRAPSFASGFAVFAAAQGSRRLALPAAQWQARCFAAWRGIAFWLLTSLGDTGL